MANGISTAKKPQPVLPPQSFSKVPELGTPVKVRNEYVYKEPAVAGNRYEKICPVCGHHSFLKSEKAGTFRLRCKVCGTAVLLKIVDKKEVNQDANQDVNNDSKPPTVRFKPKSLAGGMFTWGGFFNQKKAVLHEGTVYIGRDDYDEPSDIAINDAYVSRRSIRVDTKMKEDGCYVKITVERTSNLVLFNGKNMPVGSSVYLNYGDTITLGNTTLTFKKST